MCWMWYVCISHEYVDMSCDVYSLGCAVILMWFMYGYLMHVCLYCIWVILSWMWLHICVMCWIGMLFDSIGIVSFHRHTLWCYVHLYVVICVLSITCDLLSVSYYEMHFVWRHWYFCVITLMQHVSVCHGVWCYDCIMWCNVMWCDVDLCVICNDMMWCMWCDVMWCDMMLICVWYVCIQGGTALIWATAEDKWACVEALLRAGADATLKSNKV